jgi:hypothetical protein
MTVWEQRIIGAFTGRYPASAAASGPAPEDRSLRIRLDRIFPGFSDAPADSRESFLEAAEDLERRGFLTITWARHRKGELPSALVCPAPERLFELTGRPSPRRGAGEVRDLARTLAAGGGAGRTGGDPAWASLFTFLAEACTALDAAGGIDAAALGELARLAAYSPGGAPVPPGPSPEGFRGITGRALSVALYGDSKRLEYLLTLFGPLMGRARRRGIPVPDLSFADRSFPETLIAGPVVFDIEGAPDPLNAAGNPLGLPLETVLKLRRARSPAGNAAALLIENKESFFALSRSLPDYACFLYVGGHPNRAVRALVSLLADSGFDLHHAGDLDPDGILILQELGDIAGKIPRPLRMDAATFDRYLGCGRKLEPSMLKRTTLIGGTTRALPGIAELIGRIEATGMGVEQEIIDYRQKSEAFP